MILRTSPSQKRIQRFPHTHLQSFHSSSGIGAQHPSLLKIRSFRLSVRSGTVRTESSLTCDTANREEAVAHLSSKELSAVDVGTWFNLSFPMKARPEFSRARIATLASVFESLRGKPCIFYVEMKCIAGEEAILAAEVARLVGAFSLQHRVVVESFEHKAIQEIKKFDNSIRTAALFDRQRTRPIPSKSWIIAQAENYGADEIALHRSLAYPRLAQEAMRRGMRSVVWTVDNAAWVARAARYGMHAIITNNPARLCARRDAIFSM